jgi:type I restriction enzyme M protein
MPAALRTGDRLSHPKSLTLETDILVWRIVESFREIALAPEELLRCTVALLLIKFASDLAHDKFTFKDNNWRPVWHELVVPRDLNWGNVRSRSGDGELLLLDDYLEYIYKHNGDLLGGDLGYFRVGRTLSRSVSYTQYKLLDLVSGVDLRPSRFSDLDDLCGLIERLLLRFALRMGGYGFEYYVPNELSTLLAKLMAPRPGEDILDPACGSGFLLTKLAKHAGSGHGKILGQDRGGSAINLCMINMFFQGVRATRLELVDPLTSPMLNRQGKLLKADVIVGNPPFGLRFDENHLYGRPELFVHGLGPRSRSEYIYISHMLQVAREGVGRVGVIVPHGVLFGKGGETFRKWLVESNLISAVIGLPPKLFHKTKIQVAVLVADKGKKSNDCLFIDASRVFEAEGRLNKIPDEEIQKIVNVFESRASLSGFSCCVNLCKVRDGGCQLSIPLYVEPVSSGEELPKGIHEISREIRTIEEELAMVQEEINRSVRRLNPEFDVINQQSLPRRKRLDSKSP